MRAEAIPASPSRRVISAQQRGIRVAKGVPTEPRQNASLSRTNLDYVAHDRLAPVWPATLMDRTGKHPISRFVVLSRAFHTTSTSARRRSSGTGFCDASVSRRGDD
jgi:hypothetical protein